MSFSCYVYYRIAPGQAAQAEGLVWRTMHELTERFGVSARLARKVGQPTLWMEIYDGIECSPADFVAALEALADGAGLAAALEPGDRRHVEVFECA